jgi:hypothetical protein
MDIGKILKGFRLMLLPENKLVLPTTTFYGRTPTKTGGVCD